MLNIGSESRTINPQRGSTCGGGRRPWRGEQGRGGRAAQQALPRSFGVLLRLQGGPRGLHLVTPRRRTRASRRAGPGAPAAGRGARNAPAPPGAEAAGAPATGATAAALPPHPSRTAFPPLDHAARDDRRRPTSSAQRPPDGGRCRDPIAAAPCLTLNWGAARREARRR